MWIKRTKNELKVNQKLNMIMMDELLNGVCDNK